MQVENGKPGERDEAKNLNDGTLVLHLDRLNGNLPYGALFEQKFESVAYEFPTTEEIEASYQGRGRSVAYGRQGNPTTTSLERKLTALERGVGTVCFASGMAAYDATFATLFRSGDHVIASKFLFSNTVSLLNTYRDRFGVDVEYVDVTDAGTVLTGVKENTVAVFVESVANPKTQIPSLLEIGRGLAKVGVAYVIDNTLTTPCGFKPKDVFAALSINSLTKSIGGHGRSLGGSVTDTGVMDWTRSRVFIEERFREVDQLSYIMQLRKRGLRDKGATLSGGDAATLSMGLETLPLRLKAASENANRLAIFLQSCRQVAAVHYPGLPSHPQHHLASKLFAATGPLMSFELSPERDVSKFLNRLKIIVRSSSLGDNRTLVIAPAKTIFHELGPNVRAEMGIAEGLVRMSVGIEPIDDLIADLEQALNAD